MKSGLIFVSPCTLLMMSNNRPSSCYKMFVWTCRSHTVYLHSAGVATRTSAAIDFHRPAEQATLISSQACRFCASHSHGSSRVF